MFERFVIIFTERVFKLPRHEWRQAYFVDKMSRIKDGKLEFRPFTKEEAWENQADWSM